MRKNETAISKLLSEVPGISRSQVAKMMQLAVERVLRNDGASLDKVLPAREMLGPKRLIGQAMMDACCDTDLANQLRVSIQRETSRKEIRPKQLTTSRLISLSGLSRIPREYHVQYPLTNQVIKEFAESVEAFYKRCLGWAAKSLVLDTGRCDDLVEVFVHAGVSLEYVRPLRAFAESLIATQDPAVRPS